MSQTDIRRMRQGIRQHIKMLEETLSENKKIAEQEKRRNLMMHEPKIDIDGFVKRMGDQARKKDKSIELLKKMQDAQESFSFAPKINDKSKEIAENQPSFQKKLQKYFRAQTSERALNKQNKDLDEELANQRALSKTKSRNLVDEDAIRADNFYRKKMEWKKEADTKSFYRKIQLVKDLDEKSKLPKNYFKPKLNENRNKVTDPFEERIDRYHEKKQADLERVEKEMYDYSFKPRLYKKKTVN